jgi:hypothetical protein
MLREGGCEGAVRGLGGGWIHAPLPTPVHRCTTTPVHINTSARRIRGGADSLMRLSSGRDSQLRHKAVTAEGEAVAIASSAMCVCMCMYVYVYDSLMRLSSGRDSQLRHKAVTAEGEAVARASSAMCVCMCMYVYVCVCV